MGKISGLKWNVAGRTEFVMLSFNVQFIFFFFLLAGFVFNVMHVSASLNEQIQVRKHNMSHQRF